jgi:hypothetical protein
MTGNPEKESGLPSKIKRFGYKTKEGWIKMMIG